MARAVTLANRHTSVWTLERDKILRDLWLGSMTAALIGEQLGVTGCAVIGRARRLDLPKRLNGHTYRQAGKPAGTSRKPEPVRVRAKAERAVRRASGEAIENDTIGCQWIDGEPVANAARCGAARIIRRGHVHSWCAHHYARVFGPETRRRVG